MSIAEYKIVKERFENAAKIVKQKDVKDLPKLNMKMLKKQKNGLKNYMK